MPMQIRFATQPAYVHPETRRYARRSIAYDVLDDNLAPPHVFFTIVVMLYHTISYHGMNLLPPCKHTSPFASPRLAACGQNKGGQARARLLNDQTLQELLEAMVGRHPKRVTMYGSSR